MPGITYIKFDYQSLVERWIFLPSAKSVSMGWRHCIYGSWLILCFSRANGYWLWQKGGWKIVLLYHAKQKGSLDMLISSITMLPYLTLLMPNIKNRNQLYSKGTKTDSNHIKCNFIPGRSSSRSISVSNGNVHNCLPREWNRYYRFRWT